MQNHHLDVDSCGGFKEAATGLCGTDGVQRLVFSSNCCVCLLLSNDACWRACFQTSCTFYFESSNRSEKKAVTWCRWSRTTELGVRLTGDAPIAGSVQNWRAITNREGAALSGSPMVGRPVLWWAVSLVRLQANFQRASFYQYHTNISNASLLLFVAVATTASIKPNLLSFLL